MKNKQKLIRFILPISVFLLLSVFLLINKQQLTPREKYELFLSEAYQDIPDVRSEEFQSLAEPTRPDLAAIQDYFITLDPALGRVPVERLRKASRYTQAIHHNQYKSINELVWEGTDAKMGGRTRAIMFDPNDDQNKKVWAGGVTGGLWYNNDITDTNSQWTPVNDFWSSLSIACITYDPNNTDIFYVGTGEVQTAFTTYRESSGVGVGIFKSTDGGNTWNLMPSTEYFKYITDIAIRDENGTSVIYAGVASGYYHGASHQSEPTDGLYRSDDNGTSWEQVLPNITDLDIPYAVSDIAIGADGKIYVGSIQNIDGDGGATILHSEEGTEDSWTVYEDYRIIIENSGSYYLPGRVILANAPSDENIVYALIAAGFEYGFNYYRGRFILKTTDKGLTWNTMNKPDEGNWANLAWHAMTGVVNPQNPDNLYVGGLDVWNTFNGGANWNIVSYWAMMYYGGGPDYVHADQHMQLYRPDNPTEMIFSTDGGVFYTAEADSDDPTFEERNNNYNTLQFYTCAISPTAGEVKYVGGLQDNGSLLYQGTPLTINDMISGGDGAYCFIDQDEPKFMFTSMYYNDYTFFIHGNEVNEIGIQSGVFINPADYDYKENAIYANAVSFFGEHANSILRISDATGVAYSQIVDVGTNINTWFSHVKYSPFSPEGTTTLFLGTNSGRLFKVTNAQDNPVSTEIGSEEFPLGSISCVDIAGSEDTLILTFSNYGVSSVWQTFDGGDTWQEKEGNLPDMPIRWVIYHPDNSEQAMLATECGIYVTNELHQSTTNWETAIEGLANVRVDMLDLRTSDNTVLAATHGRGLYTTNYDLNPYVGIRENDQQLTFDIFPNPTSDFVNIRMDNISGNNYEVSIYDNTGRMIISDEINHTDGINNQYDLRPYPKGLYLIEILNGERKYTGKVVLE